MSRLGLKSANPQFNNTNHPYELTLERETEITPYNEPTDIPSMRMNFVPIDKLWGMKENTLVDVMGAITELQEVRVTASKMKQENVATRTLYVVDKTNTSVEVTIWGLKV